MSLPRLECVAAAVTMRTLSPLPERPAPADYERILQPIYGFTYGLAQGGSVWRGARPSERAWRALAGRNGNRGRIRRAALGAAIPATVWTVNRLLRAEFDADLSSTGAITRSGVNAATEMLMRLDLDGIHVITGHTHRAGPEDDEGAWNLPGGGRLHNTGSWVFASAFHHPGTPPGPYWPGTITWLEDEGPPSRVKLLGEYTRSELKKKTESSG